MPKDNKGGLFAKRRNLVILASVVVVVLFGFSFLSASKKSPSLVCGGRNCSSGCCVKNKCLPVEVSLGGYTCQGGGKWQAPDGTVTSEVPEAVVNSIDSAGESFVPKSEADYSKTAEIVKDKLDLQKGADENFAATEICTEAGDCTMGGFDKQSLIVLLWSDYQQFVGNNDSTLFSKIQENLDYLTGEGYPAQNNSLNCYLMKDLFSEGSSLSDSQKAQARKICSGGIYYGQESDEFAEIFTSGRKIAEPQIEQVIAGGKLAKNPISRPDKYGRDGIYTADLVEKYNLTKEEVNLEAAKYYFNLALELYSDPQFQGDDGAIGLAAQELYKATGDERYNTFTNYYFQKKAKEACTTTQDCVYYLVFLDYMYRNSGREAYLSEINKVLDFLFKKSFIPKAGKFASLAKGDKVYSLVENSLISGILYEYGN